ncbi:MAG: FRG domain-containing protein [Sedimentisphaerales bacterium]|nr:FRG domain-containing protein [Sedimentisphaerales bacterium]
MDEIINLSDLFRIFENQTPGRIMHFRGQVRDWPLKPSLAREGVTEQERAKEPECFERLAKILPSVNDWERATIAQHYGVPTRLIDWSENPLVGFYFALDDKNYDNEDGVIWVFEDKTAVAGNVASLRDGSGPRSLRYPRPYRAWKDLQYKIPRTVAQRGSLTSQTDLSKDFNKQIFDQNTQSLKKFIVPKKSKAQLRKQLEILGVTEERLFPDYLDIGNRRPIDLVGACMRIRCELFKT